MVKVFIFGAGGFIGNSVAKTFARAGYDVYGLTRSAEMAAELNKEESEFLLFYFNCIFCMCLKVSFARS